MKRMKEKRTKKSEEYKKLNSKYLKETDKNKKLKEQNQILKSERNKMEKKIAFLIDMTENISNIANEHMKAKKDLVKNEEKVRMLNEANVVLTEAKK